MSNFEYKLDSVKFDEFNRMEIDRVLDSVRLAMSEANLSFDNPSEEKEKYSQLTRCQLSQIANCADVFETLSRKLPRFGHTTEYKNGFEAIQLAKAQLSRCEFGAIRFENEIKKIFSRETVLNSNMPFSELKIQYEYLLGRFTALEFEKLESLEIFYAAIAGWFMAKTGFSFSDGQDVNLHDLKQVNAEVFLWLKNKLYLSFLSKSFMVNIPEGRDEWKCLIKKADELGKKLNLQLGELCIFETALKPLGSKIGYEGKFKFPEKMGQEFTPTGKYVSGEKKAVIQTRRNNVKIVLPIYIGLLKVKTAS